MIQRLLRPAQIQPRDDPARMIAEHGQGGVRLAIVAAMTALIDSLDPAALTQAIEQHRFDALWRHLAVDRLVQSLRPALNRLALIHDRSAIEASLGIGATPIIAKARPSRLKTPDVIHLTYDPLDTATVAAQNAINDAIATNIEATTQATIETIIADGLSAGQQPAQIARRLREAFGLSVAQANAIANYRAALEGDPSAALTRALRDPRFDAATRRGDLPAERIERMVTRYASRYRAFRANRLALTESLRAANQGRLAAWTQFAERSGEEVRRFWLTAGDELVCPICAAIPDMNPNGIALDEQYQTPIGPIAMPPDPHPLCRCTENFARAE